MKINKISTMAIRQMTTAFLNLMMLFISVLIEDCVDIFR